MESIIDVYTIYAISVFKYGEFMVREIRNENTLVIIFVNVSVRITIKNTELPQVTCTSYTENSTSFNIIVLWVWNVFGSDFSFTKVKTDQ